MATPYLSEIRIFSFNFPPKGWAFCNGQLLPINQNAALFSLLGTTYGGNGISTFALPDFQGRIPLGFGGLLALGQASGGEQGSGANAVTTVATVASLTIKRSLSSQATATAQALALPGSSNFFNRQPALALNFCIALQGIFPSRN